jgi:hypothetical protein
MGQGEFEPEGWGDGTCPSVRVPVLPFAGFVMVVVMPSPDNATRNSVSSRVKVALVTKTKSASLGPGESGVKAISRVSDIPVSMKRPDKLSLVIRKLLASSPSTLILSGMAKPKVAPGSLVTVNSSDKLDSPTATEPKSIDSGETNSIGYESALAGFTERMAISTIIRVRNIENLELIAMRFIMKNIRITQL